MGYESEAGTWRNIYLTGAQELHGGAAKLPPTSMNVGILAATTTPMLLDFAAVRVNPEKAAARTFKINIALTDRNEKILITVGNGVMIHEHSVSDPKAGASLTMQRPHLLMTLFAGQPFQPLVDSGDIRIDGDASLYGALVDLIEPLNPNFPIVTP
jgi:alkyl sulfatase BDS1-like metallo-beta-lactamase superfamily hydrolase